MLKNMITFYVFLSTHWNRFTPQDLDKFINNFIDALFQRHRGEKKKGRGKNGWRREISERRSSPSPNPSQDDEERSAKHRKRRDERERKEKKKKSKSEKSHGSSRNRDGKEKKSKDKSKRSRKDDDDSDFKELSKDDYFSKNNEFATWLKERARDILLRPLIRRRQGPLLEIRQRVE
uniref:Uncharacterized protein n=1 Tax=Ananas comosus var. bracteatus TaxID=296719 RepID=A0A6V7NPK4_ANACO|nr:unnamed protein product [Ananas comosus var. bracteatus]